MFKTDTLVQELHTGDLRTRVKAARMLSFAQTQDSIQALHHSLQNDKDCTVRADSAFSLGMIQNEISVPVLIKALKDRSIEVKKQVLYALGQFKTQEVFNAILERFDLEPNMEVKEVMVLMLQHIDIISMMCDLSQKKTFYDYVAYREKYRSI